MMNHKEIWNSALSAKFMLIFWWLTVVSFFITMYAGLYSLNDITQSFQQANEIGVVGTAITLNFMAATFGFWIRWVVYLKIGR